MKTKVSYSLCVALTGASMIALSTAGIAYADQKRAPIVYANTAKSSPSSLVQPKAPAQTASAQSATVTAERRVNFKYPGAAVSSDVSASNIPAAPTPSFNDPIVFTPPSAASTPESGLLGASVQAAETAPASAPAQPIRIASLQPQAVARTGQPLTLSRVRANKDAKISQESGLASIYTDGFNGQPTANGEIFDETAMTAAHPSLPLPSLIQVVNDDNGREVVVRVNDRGPFDGKRILEVSPRAGAVLGMSKGASANVTVKYLGPAPVKRTDQAFATNDIEDEAMPPVPAASAPVQTASVDVPSYVPEPAAPVQTVAAAAPASLSGFYIQAGAFAEIGNAQDLTYALGRGLNVKIEEARVNGGDFFRVLIGPYTTMDAAETQRAQLANAGIADGFLTRR